MPGTNQSLKMTKKMGTLKNIDSERSTERKNNLNLSRRTASSKVLSRGISSARDNQEMLDPRHSNQRVSPMVSRGSIPLSAQMLYLQGVEHLSERERISAEAKMRKEQEELFNCTFKPNILEISRKKSMPE